MDPGSDHVEEEPLAKFVGHDGRSARPGAVRDAYALNIEFLQRFDSLHDSFVCCIHQVASPDDCVDSVVVSYVLGVEKTVDEASVGTS